MPSLKSHRIGRNGLLRQKKATRLMTGWQKKSPERLFGAFNKKIFTY
jgi:hypothetical protein